MAKARRNRQPKPWHKMTQERSCTSIIRATQAVKITKVTPESQLEKVQKNSDKLRRQIARLKEEKDKSTTTPERKSWILPYLGKVEHKLCSNILVQFALQKQIKTNKQREITKKENLKQQMKIAQENRAKETNVNFKLSQEQVEEVNKVFPSYPKTKVESVGGRRRVVTVKQKTFSEQPKKNNRPYTVEKKITINGKSRFKKV